MDRAEDSLCPMREIIDAKEKIQKLEADNLELSKRFNEEKEISRAKIKELEANNRELKARVEELEAGAEFEDENRKLKTRKVTNAKGEKRSKESKPKVSQHYIADKDKLQSSSAIVNVDFGRHQGNTLEDAEMKRLWNKLFVYDAERDLSPNSDHSKKNEIRQDYCKKFMEIAVSVQEELIERMNTCLKASLNPSQQLISEIDLKEVKRARHILWELVNKKVPAKKPSVEDIVRMVEILKLLFTPPSTDSDQEVLNMKLLQTAFSILVNVSMVKEHFSQIKSLDTKEGRSINREFAERALLLCERMSTRVPPYLTSISKEYYVPDVHELKFVKGYLDPQKDPEIPVSYLRPIVYYNYDGHVVIRGMVVSSRRGVDAHDLGNTAAALESPSSTDTKKGEHTLEFTQEEK